MFDHSAEFGTGPAFSLDAPPQTREEFKARAAAWKANLRRTVQIRNASELVPHLPAPGESIHALMMGNYDFMLVLSSILRAQDQPCLHLRLSTLAFNKKNVQELGRLFDEGIVQRITLLCADYMDRMNSDIFRCAVEEIAEKRQQTVATARTHAKVSLLEYPNACYAIEGSANLRTNKNIEQVTVIHDRSVHDWHAEWIDWQVEHG